jgi:hypothetical protein
MLALDLKWEEITMLALSYSPMYRYRDNPNIVENDSQLFHNFLLKFSHKPSPNIELRVIEAFNFTDDPSVQENGTTLRRDDSFVLSQTEAGIKYLFSRLSNIDVLGRYMVKRYDDAQRQLESDEDRSEVGLTLWHQPGKQFALMGIVHYSQYGYEEYLGVDRGFDSAIFGVGIEKVFSPTFRCSIRGGAQSVSYSDDSIDSESAPYVACSAQLSPQPSTRFTASISKMIRETFIFPFSSQDTMDYSLRLDWDSPVPELRFAISGHYIVGDYKSDKIAAYLLGQYEIDPTLQEYVEAYGLKDSGKENTFVLSGEVAYKIGFGTTIKLVQSYEDVDSDVRWSFKRNATNLMLTREF